MDRQRNSTLQAGWGRYSRRRLLAGTGTAGMAGLFLAACGGSSNNNTGAAKPAAPSVAAGSASATRAAGSPAASASAAAAASAVASATAQIKRGGTFNTTGTSFSEVLDPHTSQAEAAGIFDYIGEEALRISADGSQLEPTMVEKWEIPGDGTEIILHPRQGLKWHNKPPVNGRVVDAKDIAYNLNRIAGKLDPAHLASYQRRSSLPNLDAATAVDATTTSVKLTAPHSGFLRGMAAERNYFVPQELVDAQAGKWNDPVSFVGTGAWEYESFQKDVKAVMKPNPDYWMKGKPYMDAVSQVSLPDRLSSLAAFSQGQIDSFGGANKDERDTLAKTFKAAQLYTWNFANWEHFCFNANSPQFADPRVRKAFQLVFDYKTWYDAYAGDGFWDYTGPLAAAFPEAIKSADIAKLPGWNPATKQQDIKTAKDLMTAAGVPDGKISFTFMQWPTASSYKDNVIRAVDGLKQVWPAMNITIYPAPDLATFVQHQLNGDYDMYSFTIFSVPDALLDLTDSYASDGSRNYGKFKDDQIDQLLKKAAGQLDTNVRAGTLKQIQDLLINTHMHIITTGAPRQVVHFSARVRGFDGAGRPFGGSGRDIPLAQKDMWFA